MHRSTLTIPVALLAMTVLATPLPAGETSSAAVPAAAPGAALPLTLGEAVSIATGATPVVQLATLRTHEAEARRAQARAALLPSLSSSAFVMDRTYSFKATGISFGTIPGFSVPNLIGPVNQVDARVKATQALFDAASWVRLRSAGQGVGVSRAEQAGASESVAQAAALAYVRSARADALLDARTADLELARQLTGLARDQLEAGTAARIDVTRARTQEATARGALLVARNQADRAAIDLARVLGLDPATRFTLGDSLARSLGRPAAAGATVTSEAPGDAAAAVALALAQRPDLAAERSRLARARSETRAVQAERLPRLDVSADYGLSNDHWKNAERTRSATLAVSMPIFDGLRREGRASEQGAVAREADVRRRDLEQQIVAEVRAALLDVSSGLEQESVALERLQLAQDELDQARERFVNGVAGNIELINAQSSLLRARDALIDARTVTATARIALARAVGVARTVR
jgi:outer membrane protein